MIVARCVVLGAALTKQAAAEEGGNYGVSFQGRGRPCDGARIGGDHFGGVGLAEVLQNIKGLSTPMENGVN